MMNKSMSVDDTLEQRGNVYGEFSEQRKCIAGIVSSMVQCATQNKKIVSDEIIAEWHYLAIKISRIAVNPEHIDSYHDLAGYATLMERERLNYERVH